MKTSISLLLILAVGMGITISEGHLIKCHSCDDADRIEKEDQEWVDDEDDPRTQGCEGEHFVKNPHVSSRQSPEKPAACYTEFSPENPQKIVRRASFWPDDTTIPQENPSEYRCVVGEDFGETCMCFTDFCNRKVPDCKVRAHPKAKC